MLSIYNFEDPIKYISSFITKKKESDSDFSLRKFTTSVGLKSPAPLIDVLSGKKKLKDKLANIIVEGLEIDASEKMYFEAILAKSQTYSEEKMKMYDLIMQELSPRKEKEFNSFKTSELDIFSHWIYMAILSLSELDDFDLTVKNIKMKLVEKVESEKIEKALFELFSHGLLVTNSDGKIQKKYLRNTTKSDISHKSAKTYYSLVCDLAKKAIDTPLKLREFSTFSMPLNKKDIPLAKEIIRKCRNNLSKLSEKEGKDEVYQVNLMMFPLSE